MSNEKFEEYLELYSKYVDLTVKLHNYHYTYIKHRGFETSIRLRTTIRNIHKLTREMRKVCLASYKEHRINEKQRVKQERLDKRAKKLAKTNKRNNKNENI